MIAADLRTAGYQVDDNTIPHQPPFAYVDSTEILINTNLSPVIDTLVVGGDWPKALNPGQAPIPPKLVSSYLPAATYTTGAETIRLHARHQQRRRGRRGRPGRRTRTGSAADAQPNDYVLAAASTAR
jgi:hypothetical protein